MMLFRFVVVGQTAEHGNYYYYYLSKNVRTVCVQWAPYMVTIFTDHSLNLSFAIFAFGRPKKELNAIKLAFYLIVLRCRHCQN